MCYEFRKRSWRTAIRIAVWKRRLQRVLYLASSVDSYELQQRGQKAGYAAAAREMKQYHADIVATLDIHMRRHPQLTPQREALFSLMGDVNRGFREAHGHSAHFWGRAVNLRKPYGYGTTLM